MWAILKWPLIIAAIVVVLRVAVERAGAPDVVANLFSVVALHFLIGPVYFAIRIARAGLPRPHAMLFKLIAIYVVLTRAMVLPTYWLARIYEWQQPRFAGLSGPDVPFFVGFIAIPFITAAIWIVASLVFGGIVGSIVLTVRQRRVFAQSTK